MDQSSTPTSKYVTPPVKETPSPDPAGLPPTGTPQGAVECLRRPEQKLALERVVLCCYLMTVWTLSLIFSACKIK